MIYLSYMFRVAVFIFVLLHFFRAWICDLLSFINFRKFLASISKSCFFCSLFHILWDSSYTFVMFLHSLCGRLWGMLLRLPFRKELPIHLEGVHSAAAASSVSSGTTSHFISPYSLPWKSSVGFLEWPIMALVLPIGFSKSLSGLQAPGCPWLNPSSFPFFLHGSQICIMAPFSFLSLF